jgi:type II secretory pathway component PulF
MAFGGKKINLNFKRGIGLSDKAVLTRNLATMLQAGLTVSEALDILASQTKGKLNKIIKDVNTTVSSGNSLSAACAALPHIFSAFYVNTVKAGEASGTLAENLNYLAEQLNKEAELRSKIKNAMFYPAIVLSLSVVLGLVLVFLVLPKIMPLFLGLNIELPLTTRALVWLAQTVEKSGLKILAGLVLGGGFLIWLSRQKFSRPITHWLLLHLPLLGRLTREKNLAQLSRSLGTLLRSGISIDEALRITAEATANYYYNRILLAVRERVSRGNKLADSFSSWPHYFPALVVGLLRVGERSGQLEEEFFNLAEIYENQVDRTVKTLASAVEPFLLVIIGLVVGGLALSIITPIYKITGNVYR